MFTFAFTILNILVLSIACADIRILTHQNGKPSIPHDKATVMSQNVNADQIKCDAIQWDTPTYYLKRQSAFWNKSSIPYILFNHDAVNNVILAAMNTIMRLSCIKFERIYPGFSLDSVSHWIQFVSTNESRCRAIIGANPNGGASKVWLNPNGCGLAPHTVLHELMHSLGFQHEQCRKDRDTYVLIDWDKKRTDSNFCFQTIVGPWSSYTPYDFTSIMHYPLEDGFQLQPKFKGKWGGGLNRDLSFLDIMKLNKFYKCYEDNKWCNDNYAHMKMCKSLKTKDKYCKKPSPGEKFCRKTCGLCRCSKKNVENTKDMCD